MSQHCQVKVLVLIPARYHSTRLPKKPLVKILGKEMIVWVWESCLKNLNTDRYELCVVTDHQEIEDCLKKHHANVVRVDDDVASGSERIFLAYERFFKDQHFDLVINIQGDEPLFTGEDISALAQFHLNSSFDISTFVKKQHDVENFTNPNIVKVIYVKKTGRCHYFSRSPIPYDRELKGISGSWYQHIGVYSYRPHALEKFSALGISSYESVEALEQLRAIEADLSIGAYETSKEFIGVDTPEDILKVEKRLK